MRSSLGFAVLLALALPLAAADPAGAWKLTLPVDRGEELMFLLRFTRTDGKWAGEYVDSTAELRTKPKVTKLDVTGDRVRFTLGVEARELASFDGVLSPDGQKIGGSLAVLGGRLQLTEMRPSKLKDLSDAYELGREVLAQTEAGPLLFEVAFDVLSQAGAKKLPAEEAAKIVGRVTAAAEGYGPRWERTVALKFAPMLARQDGLTDLALAEGRRAEALLTDEDEVATRIEVLGGMARLLGRAGKRDEVTAYAAKMADAEATDYAEYAKRHPGFKPEPFAGRKAKSDRAVLVELFTGAECPPCAAADYAFDALLQTYKPADAILLQYHVHIPAPDPLTSPASEDRLTYYQDNVSGAPTVFVGGKVGPAGGGPASAAEKKYAAYRPAVDAALEKPAGAKLSATAAKAEKGGWTVTAKVSEVEKPGPKVVLRFALAESRVRFAGGNGVRYHHMVVRAMPGGAKGFPLTEKTTEQAVQVDPEAVRAELAKYLDAAAKREGGFPRPDRPLGLRGLKVVAFVQNDETREVLQAVQVDLP